MNNSIDSVTGTYYQRCWLFMMVYLLFCIYGFALIDYGIDHYPQVASQFVYEQAPLAQLLLAAIILLMVLVLVTLMFNRDREGPCLWLLHAMFVVVHAMVNVFIYLTGSVSSPLVTLLVTSASLIMLMITNKSHAIAHAVYLIGGYLALTLATTVGWLPYAPLIARGVDSHTGFDLFWFLCFGVNTVLAFGLTSSILLASVTRERELRAALDHEANTDALTGLANRASVMRRYNGELARRDRTTCILFDIDYFKRINDRWGHLAGDQVLQQVADALRQAVRKDDTVGRFGGEEFVVVLPGATLQEGEQIANKCLDAIRKLEVAADADTIRVTVSAGVASTDLMTQTHDIGSPLLSQADDALYRAKRAGRDRTVCAG